MKTEPRRFPLPDPLPLAEQRGQTFPRLVDMMQRLLAPVGGCPWDREQTPETLRKYVQEEAAEVIDAIDSGDRSHLCEELGDLALQIVFLAELGRAEGAFGPDDVFAGLLEKMVRRHPHVFSDESAESSAEVRRFWQAIKAQEKGRRPHLGTVPRALPGLLRADRISRRAAEVGFDWDDPAGSRAKVSEELAELDEALAQGDQQHAQAELGDLLFAVCNLARHHGLDPEAAVQQTSDKFVKRFSHVEARVWSEHGDWPRDEDGRPTKGLTSSELDGYWDEAKTLEPKSG